MVSHIAAVVLLALAFLAAGIDGYAATLVVTKPADTADGICDSDCSLREAVTAAASGDTIVFSPLFSQPQAITLKNGQILITHGLRITGPGQMLLTISGNNASRIFFVRSSSVVSLSGMTITRGATQIPEESNGGAIYVNRSGLVLTNFTLRENTARHVVQGGFLVGNGSAIFAENSALTIRDSNIVANTAPTGAGVLGVNATVAGFGGSLTVENSNISENLGIGIYGAKTEIRSSIIRGNSHRGVRCSKCEITDSEITHNLDGGIVTGDSLSVLSLNRCVVSNNRRSQGFGRSGGGILTLGTTIIRDSRIDRNVITGEGGGIAVGGPTYVFNTSITRNEALQAGGGIYAGDDIYLINSTISGNNADAGVNAGNVPGGGVYLLSQMSANSLTAVNSTIADNRCSGIGGGIRNDGPGVVRLGNTLIGDNFCFGGIHDVSGPVVSNGFNLVSNTVGSNGWSATDLINVAAGLAPLGDNGGGSYSHGFMPGSPAINAGNALLAMDPITGKPLKTDQRGFARLIGPSVDIGACEMNLASVPVTVGGRVLRLDGRGVYKARIRLTAPSGEVRYTHTNSFGYYRFHDLMPGLTYGIAVTHKYYDFSSPQFVTVDQNRDDLNFSGQ